MSRGSSPSWSAGSRRRGSPFDCELDGSARSRRAASRGYDLVVLDLLLPRMDGLSVLRELHRGRPRLPVVIFSARSDLPTKLRGFELGACDYVAKPFALDELIARIRAQLRHALRPKPKAPRSEPARWCSTWRDGRHGSASSHRSLRPRVQAAT